VRDAAAPVRVMRASERGSIAAIDCRDGIAQQRFTRRVEQRVADCMRDGQLPLRRRSVAVQRGRGPQSERLSLGEGPRLLRKALDECARLAQVEAIELAIE